MRPNRFTARSAAARACASLETSRGRISRLLPAPLPMALRTLSTFRPVATTRSPAFNAASAVAAPIPLPAPVTNQTLLMIFLDGSCGLVDDLHLLRIHAPAVNAYLRQCRVHLAQVRRRQENIDGTEVLAEVVEIAGAG